MASESSPQSSSQASPQASPQASSQASPPPAASPAGSLQSSATTPGASQQSPQTNSDSASPSATREDRPKSQHPKGKRNRTSPADKAVLMQAYKQNPQPSQDEIAEITSRVSMSKQAVRIWFQNRRQNDRRKARPLSPQLIETITQGRISVSRFADPAGNSPYNPESFPADSKGVSPPELRAGSSGLPDSTGCRSDVGPGGASQARPEGGSFTSRGRELVTSADPAPPVPSWSTSGTPGYLANRRNAASAPSFASNPSHHEPLKSQPLPSPSSQPNPSCTGPDAPAWKPSSQPSQLRLSMSITGQAEIVEAVDSPPRTIPPPTPVEPVPWPDISKSSVPRRSSLSAYSSRRVPRLLRGRSSDVHVWEDCASATSQEDPLIAQAKHESSGSATAEISLLRSLSSVSANSFDQSIGSRAKRRSHLLAHTPESRHAVLKRPRLERAWSSQARIETTSALSQRHNIQRVPSYTTSKPKPMSGLDHLSLLASESDKENLSPDEDGNPRPFRRTLSSVTNPSGRRRLPSGPPSDKNGEKNPRRTLLDPQQHRPSASLSRSATSPASSSSWAAYSKQFQTGGSRQRRSPVKPDVPLIYEDDNDDRDEGGDADEVQRFMAAAAVEISPSKKKEVDAAANLIALKFAR
ncbi:uncharacterized protein P884DRAFT_208338 [Thermothelomyces heterothallicus CBS 202.75]|uniref:uncharacterized protein n=1 Tax=Thermothelomyces heterothallicus CBS 202.75 TaxID=1149848 RepID=UPI00374409A3